MIPFAKIKTCLLIENIHNTGNIRINGLFVIIKDLNGLQQPEETVKRSRPVAPSGGNFLRENQKAFISDYGSLV